MFEQQDIPVLTDKIISPRIYNRSERRKHAFVIQNNHGYFGKWDKILKHIAFEEIELDQAKLYSYEMICLMFKVDVSKTIMVTKVIRGKDGKRKFDI